MNQLIVFLIIFASLIMAQIYWNIGFSKQLKIKKETGANWEETEKFKFLSNFGKRLQTSWVIFAVTGVAFLMGFFGLVLFFTFISFLALREFLSIVRLKGGDYWPIFCAFYIFLPLQYFFVLVDWQFMFFIFIPVYVFLFTPMLSVVASDDEEQFFERASKFQWAQIACIYCLSYLPAIAGMRLKNNFESSELLIYFLAVIMFSDSLQYVFGSWLGKKKIAPKISPNKTWEGAVYGIVSASLIGMALFKLTPFLWWQSFVMSLIICIVGFLGGLVMSGIKRSIKIKDWGDILGGHGGILDRVDSMIFTAPLFYHLCHYFFR
jgi:phosphatidate cytidylyltransferase